MAGRGHPGSDQLEDDERVKIVSLLPSATETVYFLGLDEHLEGVTFECDYPPEASTKPVVSNTALPLDDNLSSAEIDALVSDKMRRGEPLYRLDERRLRSIQPDVILAQDLCHVCAVPSGQATDALAKIGCSSRVVSLDPHSLGDILDCIEEVASVTGAGGAVERLGSLRCRVERVRSRASRLPRPRTVALEWADPPFIGGHWLPEMISVAGGTDPLGSPGQRSVRRTWKEILAAEPEVFVFMPCGFGLEGAMEQVDYLYRVPGFSDTPAARAGRVYATDASAYFSRPGPRIVDGLEILAWIIHPEAFKEPPRGRVSRAMRQRV